MKHLYNTFGVALDVKENPLRYSNVQYHGTGHLNNEQVKVNYSDVSTIQIPTVLISVQLKIKMMIK